MKKALLSALLAFCLLSALPALAQSSSAHPGAYQARPYIPPNAEPSIGPDSTLHRRLDSSAPVISSRFGSRDPGLKSSQSKARDRNQTHSTWQSEQRQISERSRTPVPKAPLTPGNPNIMGTPGLGQPSFPPNS